MEKITTTNVNVNNLEEIKSIEGFLTKRLQVQGTLDSIIEISDVQNNIKQQCITGVILPQKILVEGYLQDKDIIKGSLNLKTQISGNIKVPFTQNDTYDGITEVVPAFIQQILYTKQKLLTSNIKVHEILTYEVSNSYGTTFII